MKCTVCRGPAVIDLRRHNANFCADHFLRFCRDQVAKAIEGHQMIAPGDRVLVAVSGGKDSLALWDLLIELGYEVEGMTIGLGIGDYSEASTAASVAFADERGLTLRRVDLRGEYGYDIPTAAAVTRRVPCSSCGMSKRHLRIKEPGWRRGLIINGLGAIVTAVVAVVIAATKFADGAYIILIAMPIILTMLLGVRAHYRKVGRQLRDPLRRLEEALSKKRILEIYLNVIEWGDGIYGAEAAARAVLGKSASDLDDAESALLAAMIPSPRRLQPCERPKSVRGRQERILRWMYRAKKLTEEQYQAALEERLWLPKCGSFPPEG